MGWERVKQPCEEYMKQLQIRMRDQTKNSEQYGGI